MASNGGGFSAGFILQIMFSAIVSIAAIVGVGMPLINQFQVDSSYAYAEMMNLIINISPVLLGLMLFVFIAMAMVKVTGVKR